MFSKCCTVCITFSQKFQTKFILIQPCLSPFKIYQGLHVVRNCFLFDDQTHVSHLPINHHRFVGFVGIESGQMKTACVRLVVKPTQNAQQISNHCQRKSKSHFFPANLLRNIPETLLTQNLIECFVDYEIT